jgi:hypothetical protein
VESTYRPKYPRAKLREIVTKHMTVLQTLGLTPNCDVAFVGADGAVSPAHIRAWLLKDPQAPAGSRRYVLLSDGDVWREVEAPADAAGVPSGERVWLNGPDDDLVLLLSRSQSNARLGGQGFLEDEESVLLDAHVVADRREEQRPHEGPERRHGR